MRLKKITIENFLSYGEPKQTIDFTTSSIISFIGQNGHGKSALLEAITWGIWGQARHSQGVSKSDEMVMHIGSEQMHISVEIEVKNKNYIIERVCKKKHSRIYTSLALYSILENGEEKNLSEAHQRNTQNIIDKIIGINYDIFINTVYLKQGQSNEFSKKTAKERKEILCSLLKIDKIEELRQKILDDIKKIVYERDILLKLEERLSDKKKEKALLKLSEEIENDTTTIESNKKDILKYETEYTQKLEEHNKIVKKLEITNDLIKQYKNNIEVEYAKYTIYKEEYKKYKKIKLVLKEIAKNKKCNVDSAETTEKIIQLEKEKESLLNTYEEKIRTSQKIFNEKIEAINNTIKIFLDTLQNTDIAILSRRMYEINFIIINYENNKKECFFCKKKIEASEEKNISSHIPYSEKKELEKKIEVCTQDKNKKLEELENQKKSIIKKHKEKNETILQEKNNALSTIIKILDEQKIIKNKIDLENENKKKEDFYKEEVNAFKKRDINTLLKKIIKSIHINKRKKNEEINNYTLISKEALKNKNLLDQTKKSIEKKIEKNNTFEKQYNENKNHISLLKKQINENKEELLDLKKKVRDKENILKIKSNLAHILSKNNLQAAIIDEAIPIIESEANNMLAKLTRGTSKIYIESMRDLKSGNMKETLDIKIADHVGIRYYEFFSGGEAFRIDLALRISLIKLLTQKTGDTIKTFIIDEGFGSQDINNLENIIQTLYTLQNEFDLIIIISHLQDMREQFPIQFQIQKTIQGSIIQQI